MDWNYPLLWAGLLLYLPEGSWSLWEILECFSVMGEIRQLRRFWFYLPTQPFLFHHNAIWDSILWKDRNLISHTRYMRRWLKSLIFSFRQSAANAEESLTWRCQQISRLPSVARNDSSGPLLQGGKFYRSSFQKRWGESDINISFLTCSLDVG